MSTATDRAVDRLIEAAPAAAEHVVRYMVGVAWVEIIGGLLAIAIIVTLFVFALRRADDYVPVLIFGGLLGGLSAIIAFVCVMEGITILLAPEGAAIMRAIP